MGKMIRLDLKRKKSGVPVLSRLEIDYLAEDVISDYDKRYLKEPQEFDIDLFAQEYLELDQDFQYLTHNGVYMGMTIFNDTDRLPVYNPMKRRAEWVSEKANTIVIDSRLLDEDKEQQYRFTMGHESMHAMLHKAYFAALPGQMSLFEQLGPEYCEPMIRCRRVSSEGRNRRNGQGWTDVEWMEWQANAGSSSFLMPRSAVIIIAKDLQEKGFYGMHFAKMATDLMMKTFNVSHSAAAYRLKSLNLLDKIIRVGDNGNFEYTDW